VYVLGEVWGKLLMQDGILMSCGQEGKQKEKGEGSRSNKSRKMGQEWKRNIGNSGDMSKVDERL
jgi:hypothetical protein